MGSPDCDVESCNSSAKIDMIAVLLSAVCLYVHSTGSHREGMPVVASVFTTQSYQEANSNGKRYIVDMWRNTTKFNEVSMHCELSTPNNVSSAVSVKRRFGICDLQVYTDSR